MAFCLPSRALYWHWRIWAIIALRRPLTLFCLCPRMSYPTLVSRSVKCRTARTAETDNQRGLPCPEKMLKKGYTGTRKGYSHSKRQVRKSQVNESVQEDVSLMHCCPTVSSPSRIGLTVALIACLCDSWGGMRWDEVMSHGGLCQCIGTISCAVMLVKTNECSSYY